MSPLLLLGDREERAVEQAALLSEIGRLCSLGVTDLAVEVFQAWGPGGPRDPNPITIPWWLLARYPWARQRVSPAPLTSPVGEAIQLLEHAGLLMRWLDGGGGSRVELTRLGAAVLGKGTVRQHLPVRGPA